MVSGTVTDFQLKTLQDSTGEAASEAQKHLTLYELDLGLNHVVRKWSEPVDNGANLLIPVPGGAFFLICKSECFSDNSSSREVYLLICSMALNLVGTDCQERAHLKGRLLKPTSFMATIALFPQVIALKKAVSLAGGDGPGGVLVCAENFVIFKNENHGDIRAVIPRRSSLSEERGVLIVSYATHKQKSLIFFFVQVRPAHLVPT